AWIGMREHKARHAVSECRLADAGRAADQPGVGNAAALVTLQQRALGVGMAEQFDCFTRVQDLGVVGIVVAHGATASGVRTGWTCKRSATIFQTSPATTSRALRPSI